MRHFRLLPEKTKIDFIGQRKIAFALSLLLVLISFGSLLMQGLNLGIDFEGGILIEARPIPPKQLNISEVRENFSQLELGEITLQSYDDGRDLLIRVQQQTQASSYNNQQAIDIILETLGKNYEIRRIELVGPQVGEELFWAGVMATIFSALAITLYVAFRFEWQFGLSALIGIFHDVFLTVGLFSIFGLEFNLAIVAALLTLAGYSINDTVVVFDRIREALRRYNNLSFAELINLSVNQTLRRTLLTSITTLIAILPLLFFGGPALFAFSLALCWGIIVGTYSSIYIASALLLYMPPVRKLGKVGEKKRV